MTARACSIMTNEEQNENENEKGKQELGIHTSAKRRRHCEKYVLSNEGVFWQLINSFCMHSFASLFGNSLGSLSPSLSLSFASTLHQIGKLLSVYTQSSEREGPHDATLSSEYFLCLFLYIYLYVYNICMFA